MNLREYIRESSNDSSILEKLNSNRLAYIYFPKGSQEFIASLISKIGKSNITIDKENEAVEIPLFSNKLIISKLNNWLEIFLPKLQTKIGFRIQFTNTVEKSFKDLT